MKRTRLQNLTRHQELNPMDFGKWLRHSRNEKGWSQQELAKRIDGKQVTISTWEAGTLPPTEKIAKFERIFGKFKKIEEITKTETSLIIKDDEKTKHQDLLFSLIPKDGSSITNKELRSKLRKKMKTKHGLRLTDDDYWRLRNSLCAEGKLQLGRGYGGSVRRVVETKSNLTLKNDKKRKKETSLYRPFLDTINGDWAKSNSIRDFVCEITAHKGRKDTGGRWTRPDITVVAVRTYPFIPGKNLEVITFEIKPIGAYGIEGVFETASHSAVANRSYLALHVPKDFDDSQLERISREVERFNIGLITFEDPASFETFNILVESERLLPDPASISDFITCQICNENQRILQDLIR